jgi:hypothetical protein
VGWWVCGSVTYYWKMVVSWGILTGRTSSIVRRCFLSFDQAGIRPSLAHVLHLDALLSLAPTYLDLQEVLRNAIDLLEALRMRICACARETSRHEL